MSLGWPDPVAPGGRITLHFDAPPPDLIDNLSAATRVGDTLFVAGDEGCTIERFGGDGDAWHQTGRFDLKDILPLEHPGEEADLEGLAVEDGWLWILGSHARTRPKLRVGETIDLIRLADVRERRARCLLGRVPLVEGRKGWKPVPVDGDRNAGIVAQTRSGDLLSRAMRHDPLLAPFTRLPAKEGGIDTEGVAVVGDRVALGMRGPVIRGFALLLELDVTADRHGRLQPAGAPAKRLLDLEGLGIRDLKRRGDDLLILAGPVTDLSGPVALYRWADWANDPPQGVDTVRVHRLERLFDLPFRRGCDHPEGMALWPDDRLLIVCDSPAPDRIAGASVTADLFAL